MLDNQELGFVERGFGLNLRRVSKDEEAMDSKKTTRMEWYD
jgi:hypothetical protein